MTQAPETVFDLTGKRVYVAGHRGMVGSALVRRLASEQCEIVTVGRETVDLRRQAEVEQWMAAQKPDVTVVAAATVGGILANDTHPVDFLYDNLVIETNLIEASRRVGVKKLLFLGSSCIYPRLAPQPMREDALLAGPLEPTNQWYAVAKISGIMLCRAYRRQYGLDYISAMPTNLYGFWDNFDLQSSHVIAALLAKAHAIKVQGVGELVVWGSGTPRREFLFADDLADALVFLMRHYSGEEHVNVGVGDDVTIRELAELIIHVVGIRAQLRFDAPMPDGAPRKLLDSGRLFGLGWRPKVSLEDGLRKTYAWYCDHVVKAA